MTSRTAGWAALVFVCLVFAGVQLASIDYGTRINDAPYYRDHVAVSDVVTGSALQRNTIAGAGAGESLERWITRYKLYSIEADEHINVISLARIRKADGALDPHFYQYGGAWLYPLGAWYLALSTAHVVPIADLATLLAEPDRMDAVYIWGRVFVLFAVIAAAGLLFDATRRLSGSLEAALVAAIFLAAPATIMFSQIMKPHWYALLWIVLAMHQLVIGFQRPQLPSLQEAIVAVAVGMAVGSVLTNGLFAVGVWIALWALVLRSRASPWALVRVPLVALVVYLGTNPYVALNTAAFLGEGEVVKNWFDTPGTPASVWRFIEDSILPGFGIAFSLAAFAAAAWMVARAPSPFVRGCAVLALLAIVIVGLLTASIATWHTNTRYVAYLLPAGLLLLAAIEWRHRRIVLGAVLGLTVLQSVPLLLAYADENDPARSTRFTAAAWLHDTVPAGAGLCVNTRTPAPYEVPPIDFRRFEINAADCKILVRVERRADSVDTPDGFALETRFRPRLSAEAFPMVFSHINPQISIYRRHE